MNFFKIADTLEAETLVGKTKQYLLAIVTDKEVNFLESSSLLTLHTAGGREI